MGRDSMKFLFLLMAIGGLVTLISAQFAADQWRLPLFVLAIICGLVMSLARMLAFDRTLTGGQRVISMLYEAAFWLIVIGLILFLR